MKRAPLGIFFGFLFAACGGTVTGPSDSAGNGTPQTQPTGSSSSSPPVPTATATTVPTASTKPSPPVPLCFPNVGWGPDGGFTESSQESLLSGCPIHYSFTRTGVGGNASCQAALPTKSGISAADVANALSAPGVDAAFSSGKTFGSDPRGCDGTILRVTFGARRIFVGGDCSAPSCGTPPGSCTPVPPSIAKLVDLLHTIEEEEMKTPACSKL